MIRILFVLAVLIGSLVYLPEEVKEEIFFYLNPLVERTLDQISDRVNALLALI